MESPLSNEEAAFASKKQAYCQQFALSHLDAFRPHYQTGETLGPGDDVWRNVAEHCLVEGIFADILAEAVGLDPQTRDTVVRAALLHDWYKKHESVAQSRLIQAGELTVDSLDAIKQVDSAALRDFGISEEIIALTGANVPVDEQGPQTLPEKILWYVDAMMSNTEPVSITERFTNLERGWDGQKEDPVRADRNNSFSDIYRPKYNGKSLYQIQVEVGTTVGAELAQRIGYQGDPDKLPLVLKDAFTARVLQAS